MNPNAKAIVCKGCKILVGYTHKANNVPSIYCPRCAEEH